MSEFEIEVPADLEVTGATREAPSEPLAQPDQNPPSTGTEETADTDATAKTEAEAEETSTEQQAEEPPKRAPWFVDRIARQREQIAELTRQIQEAARSAPQPGQDDQQSQRPPSQAELQQMVRAEAVRLAEQSKMQERLASFDSAGRKEFPDFVDRCNTVASLGAAENPAFMQAVTAMEDGHKVVAQLAADPERAVQILALPPIAMAVQLAKLSSQAPKPPPVSKAPAPVKPIVGSSRAEKDPTKMSDEEWFAKTYGAGA